MDFLKALARLVLIVIPLAMAPCDAATTTPTTDPSPLGGKISKVTCTIQSLALCKDKFCEAFFGDDKVKPLSFDFSTDTYINPAVGPDTRKMQDVQVAHDSEWFKVKFVIEMPQGTANVTFNANHPDNANKSGGGNIMMSAASRFSYPQDPSMVIIDSMTCQ